MLLWRIYVYGGIDGQVLRDSYIVNPAILPTVLSNSLQAAIVSNNPKAYENAVRGYEESIKTAIVVPHSEDDIIVPMFFYDVAMVPHSSYFIKKKGEVVLYTIDGDQLITIQLTPYEMLSGIMTRVASMLDPMWINRVRPRKVKVCHHDKMGRVVCYYDINNNLLSCQRYNQGGTTLEDLKAWTNKDSSGRVKKADFDWMIENEVLVEVEKQCVIC